MFNGVSYLPFTHTHTHTCSFGFSKFTMPHPLEPLSLVVCVMCTSSCEICKTLNAQLILVGVVQLLIAVINGSGRTRKKMIESFYSVVFGKLDILLHS